MKVSEAYKEAVTKGKSAGLFAHEIRRLLCDIEGFASQLDVYTYGDKDMQYPDEFSHGVDRLIAGEPLEYITGKATFLERTIKVDPRVLIPRTETEELVAIFSQRIPTLFNAKNMLSVADIGTGSGCIAMAIKDAFPSFVVYATDVSENALEVANENFNDANLMINVFKGDALKPFIDGGRKLDVIVSNPPYITEGEYVQDSVKGYEPSSALYFKEDDNVYKSIFEHYREVKAGPLAMFFEISPELVAYLRNLVRSSLVGERYTMEFLDDSNGFTRFLIVDID